MIEGGVVLCQMSVRAVCLFVFVAVIRLSGFVCMDSNDRHNIRIGSAIITVCSEENKLNIFIGGQKYCDRVI